MIGCLLGIVCVVAPLGLTVQPLGVVQKLRAVQSRAAQPDARSEIVRIQGVVTAVDWVRNTVLLHDGTCGIVLEQIARNDAVHVRATISVVVQTQPATPERVTMLSTRVMRTGHQELSPPQSLTPSEFSGEAKLAGQRVSFEGTIRHFNHLRIVRSEPTQYIMTVESDGQFVTCLVTLPKELLPYALEWFDCRAKIIGTIYPQQTLTKNDLRNTHVLINNLDDVVRLDPAIATEQVPLTTVDQLTSPSRSRVRLSGKVVRRLPARWNSERFTLEDSTGTITVQLRPGLIAPRLNETVEICGYPGDVENVLECRSCVVKIRAETGEFFITQASDVRKLPSIVAATKRPVRLVAQVVQVGLPETDLFVRDETGMVYVHPDPKHRTLMPGDLIELNAVTDAGAYSPCLEMQTFRVIESRPLPEPRSFNLSKLEAGAIDGEWVECGGVIRRVSVQGTIVQVVISINGKSANIQLLGVTNPESLYAHVGATVAVRGIIVAGFDRQRLLTGDPTLLVRHDLDNYRVIQPATTDPFQTTSQSIQRILHTRFDPMGFGHRVKIRGRVSTNDGVRSFILQDETGVTAVKLETGQPLPMIDSCVEVVGFPTLRGRGIMLLHAITQPLDPVPKPLTQLPNFSSPQGVLHFGDRIEIQGEVLSIQRDATTAIVQVKHQTQTVQLHLSLAVHAETLNAIEVGAQLSARGVYTCVPLATTEISDWGLWVPDANDLTVLDPPAFWTLNRYAFVAIALCATTISGLFSSWILRRRLRNQAEQLRSQHAVERTLQDQLKQSAKLEGVGRLAGGIAHDFNNLLTVINGCGELLSDSLPNDHFGRELVRDIRSAGERASGLTSQLLLFSRQRPVNLIPVDVNVALSDSARLLSRIVGEHIQVELDLEPDLPTVRAEYGLIHQIALNLAANARDAMPCGGTLTLSTQLIVTDAQPDLIRVCISDTGVGMDDATQAKAFEPFFTTKSIGQGTGLGLATVYGIVQTLQSQIQIHSILGVGTTLMIDLPVDGAPTEVCEMDTFQRTTLSDTETDIIPRGTVLLVEDDQGVRDVTRRVMERAGYRVLIASTPMDALGIARETRSLELLMTDVVMPQMGGRELAAVIREFRPEMQVVFMSGYTPDEVTRRGVTAEGVLFVQKPFTAEELLSKLDSALAQSMR